MIVSLSILNWPQTCTLSLSSFIPSLSFPVIPCQWIMIELYLSKILAFFPINVCETSYSMYFLINSYTPYIWCLLSNNYHSRYISYFMLMYRCWYSYFGQNNWVWKWAEKLLFFLLDLSHGKKQICIGNAKNENLRTYSTPKIDYLVPYVLQNAK